MAGLSWGQRRSYVRPVGRGQKRSVWSERSERPRGLHSQPTQLRADATARSMRVEPAPGIPPHSCASSPERSALVQIFKSPRG